MGPALEGASPLTAAGLRGDIILSATSSSCDSSDYVSLCLLHLDSPLLSLGCGEAGAECSSLVLTVLWPREQAGLFPGPSQCTEGGLAIPEDGGSSPETRAKANQKSQVAPLSSSFRESGPPLQPCAKGWVAFALLLTGCSIPLLPTFLWALAPIRIDVYTKVYFHPSFRWLHTIPETYLKIP